MRMQQIGKSIAVSLAVMVLAAPAMAGDAVRRPVSFSVHNPAEFGVIRQVSGYRIDPPACTARSVVLLQHGLGFDSRAWDFAPDQGYSYARTLADAGYSVVAIDKLGYGGSVLENGRHITVPADAMVAHQIIQQLRGEFAHVASGGHSAGTEEAEDEAGLYNDVDALIAISYTPYPKPSFLAEFVAGDNVRALASDYEYFLRTPEHRAEMFYTDDVDPAILAADSATAPLTPSGEILTIGVQPSRVLSALVRAPVYLQIGDSDQLFPPAYLPLVRAGFVLAPSVTVDVVPNAGHSVMLHRNGPAAGQRIANWLKTLPGMPPC